MQLTINENICKNKGLNVDELLCILLIRTNGKIVELINNMLSKEILVKDLFDDGNLLVTQRWNQICDKILLSGDKEIPNEQDIDKLAVQMARLFPSGIKDGTNVYWKGNKKDTILKLQKFFKLYGGYTSEQILQATQRYIDSFNGQYQTMRVLKYFILKDNESDLATQLENIDQENVRNDWNIELR